MNELTTFQYPSETVGEQCERLAYEVQEINDVRVRFNVQCRIEIGKRLNQAKDLLGHGQFGKWLEWRLPEWSEESVRRWRVMAYQAERNPKLLETLELFHSTAAAEEYVCLPEGHQQKIVECEAFTWNEFKAVRWEAAMRERLTDDELPHDRRHGDVLHAIEEAVDDPALKDVAESLYQENRETFARLADREPAEVDVEIGVTKPQPQGAAPTASLIEGDEGYWLCRYDGKEFKPVAPVSSHLLMWNGDKTVVLAAFPQTNDGPAAVSWQSSVVDAACRRVHAATLPSRFREVI